MQGGDFKTNWLSNPSFLPALRAASANGTAVDTRHARRTAFEVSLGARTDGTHTLKFQSSPDNSTWTDIDAADLRLPDDAPAGVVVSGTLVVDGATDDDAVWTIEYVGGVRYVRAVWTVTGSPSTGLVSGVNVIAGDQRYSGVSPFAS